MPTASSTRGRDGLQVAAVSGRLVGRVLAGSTTTSAPHALASSRRPAREVARDDRADALRLEHADHGQADRPAADHDRDVALLDLGAPHGVPADRHRLGERAELGRQAVGYARTSATPRRRPARRRRPAPRPRGRSRASPSPRRRSGSATTGVPVGDLLAASRAVVGDLAAELVAEHDPLVGAHEAVVAGLREHVGLLVGVVARVQVGPADAAAQDVEQRPGPWRARASAGRRPRASSSAQATAFMPRPLMRQQAVVERRQRLDQRLEQLGGLLGGQHLVGVELDQVVLASRRTPRRSRRPGGRARRRARSSRPGP